MATAVDAIREALVAVGGEATIKEVTAWVGRRYPQRWSADTISTSMADLAFPGNPSSRFTTSQRFLRRVATGRYRMAPDAPDAPDEADSPYTHRFVLAMTTAAQMHAAQRRKGSDTPYISHLLGTCAIALEYGADEDEAIAALLHDAIEDVKPPEAARMAVAWFGERVLAIVEGCSDAHVQPKPPWRERKEAYLTHLATADRSVLLVSAADKLHNVRTIAADLNRLGDEVWSRFRGGREGSLWYYRALVSAFRSNPDHHRDLIGELDLGVTQLERLAGAARPEFAIDVPALLLRISQLWDPDMSADELYDATRGHWKLGPRREEAKLAMAVADRTIREVYLIEQWHPAGTTPSATNIHRTAPPGRWEFTGRPAKPDVRAKYVGRSVRQYFPNGSQNPVRYVGPSRDSDK